MPPRFKKWADDEGLERAARLLDTDWERMVSYYRYPQAHWRHLRTTNVVESPFAALRLRTDAAKRFKKVAAGVGQLLTGKWLTFRAARAGALSR